MSNLRELIHSMSLHDGDILFVDAEHIRVESLIDIEVMPRSEMKFGVWIIPVICNGKSVADTVFSMSRADLDFLLKDKLNGPTLRP